MHFELAPTNYATSEIAIGDEASGGGDGGAPLRYNFTRRGWNTFSPWNTSSYAYSILQINLGYNPLSKLEIVSVLNMLSQGVEMYYYSPSRTPKYNVKISLGSTPQTVGIGWIYDSNYPSTTESANPEGKTQKQVF